MATLNANIICKNGPAASWKSANPVLLKGQMGVETDTGKFKFGDGVKAYNELEYASTPAAVVRTDGPEESDYGYDVGQVWVNSSTQMAYVLTDNSQNAAVWKLAVTSDIYATAETGGVVRSSGDVDKVKVEADGTMSLNTVSADKVSGSVGLSERLTTARKISLSGDLSSTGDTQFDGSRDLTLNAVLATVVDAGSGCKVTVNAKGLVTAIDSLTVDDLPAVPNTKVTGLGTASTKDTGLGVGNVVIVAADGKIDSSLMPDTIVTHVFEVENQAAMLALNANRGDIAVRTDVNRTYVLKETPANVIVNWTELKTPADAVLSVNGKTGAVALTTSDVAEGTNLYYTQERATSNFNANFVSMSSSGLTDGASILHSSDVFILDGSI